MKNRRKFDPIVGSVSLRFLDTFKREELKKVLERKPSPDDPELTKLNTLAVRVVTAPQNRDALDIVLLRKRWLIYLFSSPTRWGKIKKGALDVVFMDPLGGEEYWAKISQLRPFL